MVFSSVGLRKRGCGQGLVPFHQFLLGVAALAPSGLRRDQLPELSSTHEFELSEKQRSITSRILIPGDLVSTGVAEARPARRDFAASGRPSR